MCILIPISLKFVPYGASANYTIVWFFRAPRWYIGPTAMPRAAVTPIAPERSEGAIGCDSRPRHCRRDDIPAWRPNKITLLSLLPLDLTMYHHFISFLCAVQSREGVTLIPDAVCKSRWCRQILSLARGLEREPHQTMGITWCAHPISGKHF